MILFPVLLKCDAYGCDKTCQAHLQLEIMETSELRDTVHFKLADSHYKIPEGWVVHPFFVDKQEGYGRKQTTSDGEVYCPEHKDQASYG